MSTSGRWIRALVAFAIATTSATSCAKIYEFKVNRTCVPKGGTVHLTWRTNGWVTLSSTPDVLGVGGYPQNQAIDLTLTEATAITLSVDGTIGHTESTQEISVEVAEREIGDGAKCVEGVVTTTFALEGSRWTGLTVDKIALPMGGTTALVVEHCGCFARLSSTTKSTGLSCESPPTCPGSVGDALPVAGSWTVHVPESSCEKTTGEKLSVALTATCTQ